MNTFDDIVLSYDLQLNQFKEELAFDQELLPAEMEYKSVTEREYNHDSFAFYTGDDLLARNHFFMQMRKLAELPRSSDYQEERLFLLKIACEDLEKYVFALSMRRISEPQICSYGPRMATLILAYGGAESLYALIKEKHAETIRDYDGEYADNVSDDGFFDFYQIYEQYGDYALFILQDVDTALKYYELAALDWYYFEGEVEWDISSAKKEAILRRGQEFRRMSQLVRNPGESVSLWRRMVVWDGEEAYKESFIEYIHNLNAKDHSGIYQCATAFFHNVSGMIDAGAARDDLRVAVLLAHVVRDSSLYSTMVMIAPMVNKIQLSAKTKHDMFECLCANQSKTLVAIRKYLVNVGECEESFDVCFRLLTIKECVQRIARFLRVNPTEETELAYYTSLQTFSYMLPFKAEKGMEGKLSVMNIAYMNDPNEGRTLQKSLFAGEIPFEGDIRHRKDARYPYVFIKCFTPQIDFLPMWEMYGDYARGCCLVLDWSRIRTQKMEVPLYHVCYLSSDVEDFHVEQQFNANLTSYKEMEEELHELAALCDLLYRKNDAACLEAMHSILNEILYLFKDSSMRMRRKCVYAISIRGWMRHFGIRRVNFANYMWQRISRLQLRK